MGENAKRERGFTLIELSIVLVVIGLIVGGVLVGQDLIRAAGERAQITQIEKFNTAANTFFGKYGYLPGDIKDPDASSFGFKARGAYAGEGDGNGVLEGITYDQAGSNNGHAMATGELGMFWVDLSTAHLIDGSFSTATANGLITSTLTPTSNPAIGAYLPAAQIGGGNYTYIWSAASGDISANHVGFNNFAISGLSALQPNSSGNGTVFTGLTVKQAYDIDTKVDDGLSLSGKVIPMYELPGNGMTWAAGGGNIGLNTTAATPASSTTCYDNGGATGVTPHYSIQVSSGANVNCVLIFRMQAGD